MHNLHEHLTQSLAERLKKRRVVIWYDPRQCAHSSRHDSQDAVGKKLICSSGDRGLLILAPLWQSGRNREANHR